MARYLNNLNNSLIFVIIREVKQGKTNVLLELE